MLHKILPHKVAGEHGNSNPKLLTYSPNGELLASISHHNRIDIWDVLSGLNSQSMSTPDYIYAAAFAPDPNLLQLVLMMAQYTFGILPVDPLSRRLKTARIS